MSDSFDLLCDLLCDRLFDILCDLLHDLLYDLFDLSGLCDAVFILRLLHEEYCGNRINSCMFCRSGEVF